MSCVTDFPLNRIFITKTPSYWSERPPATSWLKGKTASVVVVKRCEDFKVLSWSFPISVF